MTAGKIRGIPRPREELKSMHATVLRMIEVIETEVQGNRDASVARSSTQALTPQHLAERVKDLEDRLDKAGL